MSSRTLERSCAPSIQIKPIFGPRPGGGRILRDATVEGHLVGHASNVKACEEVLQRIRTPSPAGVIERI